MEKKKFVFIVGCDAAYDNCLRDTILDRCEDQGVTVEVCSDLNHWSSEVRPRDFVLLLVDNEDYFAKAVLFQTLVGLRYDENRSFKTALFNVAPDDMGVLDSFRRGVCDIFLNNDSPMKISDSIAYLIEHGKPLPRDINSQVREDEPEPADHGDPILQCHLTVREMQILGWLCTGATNDEIADRLSVSSHTVKTHVYNIFPKIGVRNRLEAALWANRNIGPQIDRLLRTGVMSVAG